MTVKTQFDKYDTVHYLHGGKVKCNPINAIKINVDGSGIKIRYRVEGEPPIPIKNHIWMEEEKCFTTKELLLQSL